MGCKYASVVPLLIGFAISGHRDPLPEAIRAPIEGLRHFAYLTVRRYLTFIDILLIMDVRLMVDYCTIYARQLT